LKEAKMCATPNTSSPSLTLYYSQGLGGVFAGYWSYRGSIENA